MVKNPPAIAGEARDMGSIPGSRGPPGEGNGNPFQCSCLENPIDRRSLAGYSPWGSQRVRYHSAHTHNCNSLCHIEHHI